jgi:prephenate dehydrogenase
LLEAGGRALREMTRISSSPYSMWRDIALTNKKNIRTALLRLEQHLAHIRENLDTRELAMEFERAHQLRKTGPTKRKQLD